MPSSQKTYKTYKEKGKYDTFTEKKNLTEIIHEAVQTLEILVEDVKSTV